MSTISTQKMTIKCGIFTFSTMPVDVWFVSDIENQLQFTDVF